MKGSINMKIILEKLKGFLCEHLLFTIILIGIIGFLLAYWTIPILESLNNLSIIIIASLSFVTGIFIFVWAIIGFVLYIASL